MNKTYWYWPTGMANYGFIYFFNHASSGIDLTRFEFIVFMSEFILTLKVLLITKMLKEASSSN